MKWKTPLAVVGLTLLMLGLQGLASVYFRWPVPVKFAYTKPLPPDRLHSIVPIKGGPTTVAGCQIATAKDKDTVTLNVSFPLTVTVSIPTDTITCESHVSVYAPAFDVKPESQAFTLVADKQGKQTRTFTFLLIPKQDGPQLVKVDYNYEEDMLHYRVKPSEVIPAWMSPFLGPLLSLLGPTLTIPWWIERREKKKEAAQKKADEEAKKKADEAAKRKVDEEREMLRRMALSQKPPKGSSKGSAAHNQ